MSPTPPPEETTIERTDAEVPRARLERDAGRVLDTLERGGVAIVPLDVAYAIVGQKPPAIRRIFDAKQRSYEKPSGMLATWQISRELHVLSEAKHAMVRTLVEEENLPFSVVAPFRGDHPFLAKVESFVRDSSTKADTLDLLLNAGALHTELGHQSWQRGHPLFGSSANTSLKGSKYRLEDIEPRVRDAADLAIDYGVSKYANDQGRSSTIIDFRDFTVVRPGVCLDRLKKAFSERFGVELVC